MTALVLEPHADDAALFCAFNAIRYQAKVVTVLSSQVQWDRGTGITNARRVQENADAMQQLGIDRPEQWPYSDAAPAWDQIGVALRMLDERLEPEIVFAPAVELGAHDHHNQVGDLADIVFGRARVVHYLTYTPAGKSVGGSPAEYEPGWVALKLRALACFESQIATAAAGCTPHFVRGLEEYVT